MPVGRVQDIHVAQAPLLPVHIPGELVAAQGEESGRGGLLGLLPGRRPMLVGEPVLVELVLFRRRMVGHEVVVETIRLRFLEDLHRRMPAVIGHSLVELGRDRLSRGLPSSRCGRGGCRGRTDKPPTSTSRRARPAAPPPAVAHGLAISRSSSSQRASVRRPESYLRPRRTGHRPPNWR